MRGAMYPITKRGLDLVLASLVLLGSLPILLVIAALVAFSVGRPVLFRQIRPGRSGEPFELVKFRTMREGSGSDDERLTRVGRFLRSTSLDELPELWNVIAGHMSLVGPRPLLVEYLPLYSERQALRHEVRPGLTGLAQVSGRNAIGWGERLEADAVYVEQASPGLDLRILVRTIALVLRRDGISAEGHATMELFAGESVEPSAGARVGATR